jgi:glycosyltransferase involved in cell wall biosynthesis
VSDAVVPPRRRLLFLCSVLGVGGAEHHWATLLTNLVERGAAPRLVALKSGGRAFDTVADAGIPTRVIGARGGLKTLLRARNLLQERLHEPEVVVTWGADAALLGCVLSRRAAIPHLIHWHAGPGSSLTRRQVLSFRAAAGLGGGAIAVTRAQVPELVAFGYPLERIRVGRPGVPPPPTRFRNRAEARADLGLPQQDFIALVVARLSPEKCLDRFVQAIGRTSIGGRAVTGLVVGDGPERSRLEQLAAEISAPVKFVGYREHPADYMVAADVVCLTSGREALPLTILEAAACGRPSITMDVGGVRDVIEHDVTGLVTPGGDVAAFATAVATLAASRARVDELGAAAKVRWQERYSLESMLGSYDELLSTVEGPPVRWSGAGARA